MPFPANVTFVGPVLDGPALVQHRDAVDIDDGRDPMVLVSFSTSDQAQAQVLQRCIDAFAAAFRTGRRDDRAVASIPRSWRRLR